MGLADSTTGSNARCVWKSLDGQEIYLTLESTALSKGARVTGTIIGGTGKVQGITGTLSFEWSSMSFHREKGISAIGGYAKDLSGSYQLP